MKRVIDARGLQCPMPVIQAKQAMEEVSEIEIYVDNEIAVQNLKKLAEQKQYQIQSEQQSEHTYVVVLSRALIMQQEKPVQKQDQLMNKVVVISSSSMGSGDEVLGSTLMKGFIYALTQLDVLPSSILMYNSGVFLSCEGSKVVEDLQVLADRGVEILSCGMCLQHYQLQEQLVVGEVTNMYAIVEKQMQADGVIRP